MAGGFCLKWTAWRVWLHPQKALRRLNEAEKMETDLKQRLDETLELLERQRKETSIQSFHVAELSRTLTDTAKRLADEHRELEETHMKLTRALDTLADHKSVDEKIEEFNKQLNKVEELKRGYEKRITELEARLGDARKRLAVTDDSDLVEPIDMLDTRQFPAGPPPKLRPNGSSMHHTAGIYRSKLQTKSFIDRVTSSQIPLVTSADSPPASPQKSEAQLRAEAVRPVIEEKDTTTIEGKPEETAEKVASYLKSMQSEARQKRAGRSDDDWLSELPDL